MGGDRSRHPARELFRILAMASDRYPISICSTCSTAMTSTRKIVPRRQAFREQMRDDVRRRLG